MAITAREGTAGQGVAAGLRPGDPAPTALIVGLFLVVLVFPHRIGLGGYLQGGIFGADTGIVAVALVLVFRSSRVVNFAQFALGALPAITFYELVHKQAFSGLLDAACGCARRGGQPVGWAADLDFFLSALICLVFSAVLGALAYALLVRRFRNAPALAGTVATIALALALDQLAGKVPSLVDHSAPPGSLTPPGNVSLTVGSGAHVTVFHTPDLATAGIALALVPIVATLLRRTRLGVGVRAAADNPERAATLGVDDTRVTTTVWAISGLLSGLAAMLSVTTVGVGGVGGTQALVEVLVALVLARTRKVGVALVATVGFGVLTQGILTSFSKGELVSAVLLGVALLALFFREPSANGRVDVAGTGWAGAREVRPVPVELRHLPEVRRLGLRVGVVVALLAIGYPYLVATGAIVNGTVTLIYAMVGLSLLVLTGWAGLASLGQFAFAAVGGFAVALIGGRYGVTGIVAIPIASLAGAGIAVAVGLPALRVRGFYLAIATLAFSLATTTLLLGQGFGGSLLPNTLDRLSVFGFSFDDERAFYYLTLAFLGLITVAVAGLRRSKGIRALIAARDNERAASMYGVDLVRARVQAFAVSGFIASFAGALYAYQQRGVNVGNYDSSLGLLLFLMVVIGGLGSLSGPILGAIFIEAVTQLTPGYGQAIVGLTAALVLIFTPGGLTQLVFAGRDALLRRIALRRRIYVPSLATEARPAFRRDARVPLAAKLDGNGFVPVTYRLPRQPLTVPVVAATGRGAQ